MFYACLLCTQIPVCWLPGFLIASHFAEKKKKKHPTADCFHLPGYDALPLACPPPSQHSTVGFASREEFKLNKNFNIFSRTPRHAPILLLSTLQPWEKGVERSSSRQIKLCLGWCFPDLTKNKVRMPPPWGTVLFKISIVCISL